LHVIAGGVFIAFNAYIWSTAPTFGSQPECNDSTVYVVFGVSLQATNVVFRWTILATIISFTVGGLVGLLVIGTIWACCCGVRPSRVPYSAADIALVSRTLGAARPVLAAPAPGRKPVKLSELLLHQDFLHMLIRSGVNVYGIVALEQTVARNHLSDEESRWTFGQVLAIFLLLGVVIEVLNVFLAKLDGKGMEPEEPREQGDNVVEELQEHSEAGAAPRRLSV
jgi:hypothetical protein